MSAARLTHERPHFGIDVVSVAGNAVAVREEPVQATPFGTLVHFAKELDERQPRVLVLPGLAGHFSTLLRGTVRTLLPDHDVYIADWRNARDIPPNEGRFGFEDYIGHIIEVLEAIGPSAHLMAVCQPCPAALAAAAIMAHDGNPAQPQSLVLMAGPVDARINPGPVNDLAGRRSLGLLERTVIVTVPPPYRGAGRRVYPGFLQVGAFMSMNPRRRASAVMGLFRDALRGDEPAAHRRKDFYEEYFAVLDLTAEFYLETARAVFIDHDLAQGRLQWSRRLVDPAAITSALLTVEGENDELCAPGQTLAAHDLCTGIPRSRKRHHLQPGVGHYGVFSGTRFEQEIYPEIRRAIASAKAIAA